MPCKQKKLSRRKILTKKTRKKCDEHAQDIKNRCITLGIQPNDDPKDFLKTILSEEKITIISSEYVKIISSKYIDKPCGIYHIHWRIADYNFISAISEQLSNFIVVFPANYYGGIIGRRLKSFPMSDDYSIQRNFILKYFLSM